jgi:hypothetical protein
MQEKYTLFFVALFNGPSSTQANSQQSTKPSRPWMVMVTGTIQEVHQQRIRKEVDGGQKLHVECVASCPMHVSRLPHRSPHHHSSCCCVKQLQQICDETRCRPD